MTKETINGRTVLTADDGKVLTRNGISGRRVVLGAKDSEVNWIEADAAEAVGNEEIPAEEALKIITGGDGNDDQG